MTVLIIEDYKIVNKKLMSRQISRRSKQGPKHGKWRARIRKARAVGI